MPEDVFSICEEGLALGMRRPSVASVTEGWSLAATGSRVMLPPMEWKMGMGDELSSVGRDPV